MLAALLEPEQGARAWGEAALWALPCAGALLLFLRGARGRRLGWLLIAAGCAAVVLDKAVDLQTVLHQAGQGLVRHLDPEHRMRGPNAWMRWVLLGGGFALGAAVLVAAALRDRGLCAGRRLGLLGLVLVLGFLAVRLLPAVKVRVDGGTALLVEGLCWLLVLAGVLRGARRPG